MKLVQTITLPTTGTSIEFTNIPQDGTDLIVRYSLRKSSGAGEGYARLTLNNINSGYSYILMYSSTGVEDNSVAFGVVTRREENVSNFKGTLVSGSTAIGSFSNGQVYIPNYTSSQNKSISCESVISNDGGTAQPVMLTSGVAAISGPVTSLKFSFTTETSGNPTTASVGSTISIYKITKGSDGIATTS